MSCRNLIKLRFVHLVNLKKIKRIHPGTSEKLWRDREVPFLRIPGARKKIDDDHHSKADEAADTFKLSRRAWKKGKSPERETPHPEHTTRRLDFIEMRLRFHLLNTIHDTETSDRDWELVEYRIQ
jgi:hypothetical protein